MSDSQRSVSDHSPLFSHLLVTKSWLESLYPTMRMEWQVGQGVSVAPVLGWSVLGKTARCKGGSWKVTRPKELVSYRGAEERHCAIQSGSVAPTGCPLVAATTFLKPLQARSSHSTGFQLQNGPAPLRTHLCACTGTRPRIF